MFCEKNRDTSRGVPPIVATEGDLVCIEALVEGKTKSPYFYSRLYLQIRV
jgi:hypothetical protein